VALPLRLGQHHRVRIHKFESTTAFVAIDLADVEVSSGPVRWARKVLQGGAKDLARSQTYTFAVLGMKRGGASAGVSAEGDARGPAISAFVEEAAYLVAAGTYLPDAAKGVSEVDLSPLRDSDPRDTARMEGDEPTFAQRCDALSAVACAESTVGSLVGRSVAIEAAGPVANALATLLAERGAGLVAGPGVEPDADALDSAADIMFVGSKMCVVNHGVAEKLIGALAVVPCGRVPITAKALAVLRRAEVAVPADFVALAGSTIALWGDPARTKTDIEAEITERIGSMCTEFAAHTDGPLLGACYRAEEFLATWQATLPFGRPLAP